MALWKRTLDWANSLGAGPRWWLWFVPLGVLGTATGALARPWDVVAVGPLAAAAVLLFDGHARWQRDEVKRRTST